MGPSKKEDWTVADGTWSRPLSVPFLFRSSGMILTVKLARLGNVSMDKLDTMQTLAEDNKGMNLITQGFWEQFVTNQMWQIRGSRIY